MPAERRRTVVVTGSSSGIGRAVAELLLDSGYDVLGVARHHEGFEPASDGYHPVTMDLAELERAGSELDRLAREHPRVDAVIAGAGSGSFGELEQFSASQIRRAIDLNLTSYLLVARSFLPAMKRAGHGDLVIMGSVSGQRGARKGSLYCAAKFGLRGMAQALRDECARSGVRVTLVSPGFVRTPFFDGLDFEPEAGDANALSPEAVAGIVLHVLRSPANVVFDEISVTPRHHTLRHKGDRRRRR